MGSVVTSVRTWLSFFGAAVADISTITACHGSVAKSSVGQNFAVYVLAWQIMSPLYSYWPWCEYTPIRVNYPVRSWDETLTQASAHHFSIPFFRGTSFTHAESRHNAETLPIIRSHWTCIAFCVSFCSSRDWESRQDPAVLPNSNSADLVASDIPTRPAGAWLNYGLR